MTTEDDRDGDDGADDPKLTQLRAVWVSMRDEEPSDRGLSALMAAARTKAAEMQPTESWWQRLLATLRTPPVLALATVTLLIGGAVVISQRENMKAESVVEKEMDSRPASERSRESERGAALQEAPAAAAAGSSAPAPTDEARPPPLEPPPIAPGEGAARNTALAPPVMKPRPPASRPPSPSKIESTVSATKRQGTGGSVAKDAPRVQDSRVPVATTPLAIAADDDGAPAPQAGAASEGKKEEISRKPAPAIQGEDRLDLSPTAAPATTKSATTRAPTQPTIEQLVKQCTAAAERGDCAAAKALAARIAKADPSAYRTRLVTQTAVARCLQ